MTLGYKLLAGLLLLLAAAGGGYYMGRGQVEVQVQEKIVYKEGETKTVDHIVTITKTVNPDGTTTETTKTEDKQVDKKTVEKDKEKDTTTTPLMAQYKLGLGLHEIHSLADLQDYTKVYVEGSRRVLGPIWLSAGVGLDRSLSLGVSYEF